MDRVVTQASNVVRVSVATEPAPAALSIRSTKRMTAESTHGSLVARTLHRSWRSSQAELGRLTIDELDAAMPLLYESGAAGLGWWRIRQTELRDTPSGELLH